MRFAKLVLWVLVGVTAALTLAVPALTQHPVSTRARLLPPVMASPGPAAAPALTPPPPDACDRPLPINLATALQLAHVHPLDIALTAQRVQVAAAQLDRARVLWLPTLFVGADYYRHDGQLQDIRGDVFGTSKQSFMAGVGPSAVFAVSDAVFAPLAARQELRAREAAVQAAVNDTMLTVAESYFDVQQARGQLAGARDVVARAEQLVRKAEDLATGLIPPVEAVRARTGLAAFRQTVHATRERWRTSSAELVRVLRLDPGALVEPLEPPHLQVTLIDPCRPVDELIQVGLTSRPELAGQQAVVQATLERLRQEKLRPLIPSILLRGTSTPVTGTLAAGVFGGGRNDDMGNFSVRSDFDLQVLWEFQNLGFGNRARVHERKAENQLAILELFRLQDRIAAEVARAHAQVRAAAARLCEAEAGLKDALDSVEKNFEGLGQTKRAGAVILLVIRPQEALAAVQALAQAYNDFYGAVADYDRAQFRLFRALGHPADTVTAHQSGLPPTPPPPPAPPAVVPAPAGR